MNFESISDLITTMVLQGASHEEITRIVTYSQKAIDAHKAYRDNNIAELERKYGGYIAPHFARRMIEELPVRHGAWLPCDKKGYILTETALRDGRRWYGYKCSECNIIYHGNTFTKYCPNCGAKMDAERKEE